MLAQRVEDARAFIGILSEGAIADAGDASDAPRIAWLANAPFAIDHEPVTACARAAAERLAARRCWTAARSPCTRARCRPH